MPSSTPSQALHVMAKPTGARCNLDCAYCFFLKIEQLYPGSTVRYGESAVCVLRPTCGEAMALEHNGDLYSCDHFVEPRHRRGNTGGQPMREMAELLSVGRYADGIYVRQDAALVPGPEASTHREKGTTP